MQVCGMSFSLNTCVFLSFAVFSQGLKKSSLELYGLICYGELRKKIGGCEYSVFFRCHEMRKLWGLPFSCRGRKPFPNHFQKPLPDVSSFPLLQYFAKQLCRVPLSGFVWERLPSMIGSFCSFTQSRRKQRTRKEASVIWGCNFTYREKSLPSRRVRATQDDFCRIENRDHI